MKGFLEKLREEWVKKGSLFCFGMDPVVERMKINPSSELSEEIYRYFSRILHAILEKVSAVKPNAGFYLQYGQAGLSALLRLVRFSRSLGLPVIIDGKIGDIGNTSKAYARFVFDLLEGDGITLNPYMGYDALAPFFSYGDKGFYILALTSNEGARDFQYRALSTGMTLYDCVIQEICAWNRVHPSVGAVIGATHREFRECIEKIKAERCTLPLLVPGVGAQGGSYRQIERELEDIGYDREIVRINASSSISYAHEIYTGLSVEEASFRAMEDLLET
jgi:orotidine 5'-phosphate decarboxylase subfamily 2